MYRTKQLLPRWRPQDATQPDVAEDAVEWVGRRLGFAADALQARVLRSNAPFGILNCSRQWGKSTVAAAKAVHTASTRAGSTVLVTAPSLRQSRELIRKTNKFVRAIGGHRVRGGRESRDAVYLRNGSRIVGLPGTEETVRGFSAPALIIVDEASKVPDGLYMALRPMLATSRNGSLWLLSTPWTPSGFFWEEWTRGGPEWERVEAKAEECPRIPAAFLERERLRMPQKVFEQEYCCQFHGAEAGLFDPALVEEAVSDDCEAIELWDRPRAATARPRGSGRIL